MANQHTIVEYPIEVIDEGTDSILIFSDPAMFAEFERAELAGEITDLDLLGVKQRLMSLSEMLQQTLLMFPK